MSTPALSNDPLARLLSDLKINHNTIEKTLDGIKARVIHLDADLKLEISRNTQNQWTLNLSGQMIGEVPITARSRAGARSEIRELFNETFADYMKMYQAKLSKALSGVNTLASLAAQVVDGSKIAYI